MFMRFDEKCVNDPHYRDPFGYPRTLNPDAHERMREGFRFICAFYYALILLFVVSIVVIAYLSVVS